MKKYVAEAMSGKQKALSLAADLAADWNEEEAKAFLRLMTQYKCAMMEIETRINLLKEEHMLEFGRAPVSSIKSRLKTPQSIKEKMSRKGLPITIDSMRENLNDIAGVRAICAFPEDVNTLAIALLRQDDITLLQKKDYIECPKENGYRSLHMIVTIPVYLANENKRVKVEIQLRTIAMDFWASLEHQLRYKSNAEFTPEMAKELYQCAQLSAELDNRMDRLRKSVQKDF